jgi:hypothetical protein
MAEFSLHEEWNSTNITDPQPLWERRCNFRGHVLKAGWRDGPPFVYTTNESTTGEQTISGVNYDLAISLANLCNFSLQLEKVDVYGALQSDGTWTGIVKKLQTKELDIGIADISHTMERAQVIDFSIGISETHYVLFMRMTKQVLQWNTFIDVFSSGFWYCLITFVTSLTVFLCIIKINGLGKSNSAIYFSLYI